MLIHKIKDIKKRKLYFKFEYLKKIYKIITVNLLNNLKLKKKSGYYSYKLLKLNNSLRLFSKIKVKNRCIISNRNKAVMRPFFLSRIKMRELINEGVLPGYKKAVW